MNNLLTEYELWVKQQDFYVTLRFSYGDAIFIRDGFVYRTLPIQLGWLAWQTKHNEIGTVVAQFDEKITDIINIVEKKNGTSSRSCGLEH